METIVTATNNPYLAYLAGCLRAAKIEMARVEASAADYPADVYSEVLEDRRAQLRFAQEEFRMEFQAVAALEELDLVSSAPVAAKLLKARCPHWKAIKRAFAIAKENDLDTTKAGKARMRYVMGDVIGQCVNSRGEYSGSDWMRFGDAIKSGTARW